MLGPPRILCCRQPDWNMHVVTPPHTALQMPEEMNFDPEIVDTREAMKQLHPHFIEVHRQCEQIRSLTR